MVTLMQTLIDGLVGGFVATIVMSVAMNVLGDGSPPPTAILWAKYVAGGEPDDHTGPGMILHLGYGSGAGGAFALGASVLGLTVGTFTGGIGWGLVWGLGLFVVGTVFWMNVILGLDADRDMLVQFGVVHAIYGIVLGAWVALGLL